MKHISFLGAAGTVTGSNFLITDNEGYGMLVDMGMFQGKKEINKLNYNPLEFDPRDVHVLFLTHAHLDHVGRLPMLTRGGFTGSIFATKATKKLAEIVLYDSAKIQEKDEDKPLLYSTRDVEDTLSKFEIVDYNQPFKYSDYDVLYKNAGHILGSASIKLEDKKSGKKIIFSGDLGNTPEDIVKPTEYFDEEANFVVMETTYGDRTHPNEHPEDTVQKEINEIEKSRGTLLIPSFSIERTQVILHIIDHLKKQNKVAKETAVYLDSPMGQKATLVYSEFKDLYNVEMADHVLSDNPFDFPGLTIVESAKQSKGIKKNTAPKVIIAGSGMMNGGRIGNHAIEYLPQQNTRLLIVGFQAEETPGRAIEEGDKEVEFYGQKVKVNANINALHSMSAHADKPRLLDWLSHIKNVEKTFLIHGEDPSRSSFLNDINGKKLSKEVFLPELNQSFVI